MSGFHIFVLAFFVSSHLWAAGFAVWLEYQASVASPTQSEKA